MDIIRIIAGEENDKYRRAVLVLRVLGWTSIVWGCMISIWIWTGLKAGSDLWLYWTIGQFVFGAICLAAAGRIQLRAAHLINVPEPEVTDRVA
jgi:hypothetical protein